MCLHQAVYNANDGDIAIYIDNVLKSGDTDTVAVNSGSELYGHIDLGRAVPDATIYGIVTIDWLTIWDRVLTVDERNLVHLD